MQPDKLYEIFREALLSEGVIPYTWKELDAKDMIAWGKLCRTLQREWGLKK